MSNTYAEELVQKQNLKRAKELYELAMGKGDPELFEKAADFFEAAGMDYQAMKCRTAADICRAGAE